MFGGRLAGDPLNKQTLSKQPHWGENTQHLCTCAVPRITMLTPQDGVPGRVSSCGQCHDKLSILSVTVAGSPSGMTGRGGVGVMWTQASPSSHTDVSVGQRVTESANCNLSSPQVRKRSAAENDLQCWKINACHGTVLWMVKVSFGV